MDPETIADLKRAFQRLFAEASHARGPSGALGVTIPAGAGEGGIHPGLRRDANRTAADAVVGLVGR